MHGTKFFSFKHNAWAVVTDDAVTSNGFYTVAFPAIEGMYRRYNAERIQCEVNEHYSVDIHPAAQAITAASEGYIPAPSSALSGTVYQTVPIQNEIDFIPNHILEQLASDPRTIVPSKPEVQSAKEGKLITLYFEGREYAD